MADRRPSPRPSGELARVDRGAAMRASGALPSAGSTRRAVGDSLNFRSACGTGSVGGVSGGAGARVFGLPTMYARRHITDGECRGRPPDAVRSIAARPMVRGRASRRSRPHWRCGRGTPAIRRSLITVSGWKPWHQAPKGALRVDGCHRRHVRARDDRLHCSASAVAATNARRTALGRWPARVAHRRAIVATVPRREYLKPAREPATPATVSDQPVMPALWSSVVKPAD